MLKYDICSHGVMNIKYVVAVICTRQKRNNEKEEWYNSMNSY